MRSLRAWVVRFASLFDGGRGERDMDDELESHLQLHTDENVRRGMTSVEARRQAVLALGGVEPTREAYRDRRGIPWIETLTRDLRYALRVLVQRPGFSVAAIAVLALGIGANTAIFSVVHAVLLRPLPYPEPDRLVQVWHVPPPASFPGQTRFAVSPANYEDWHRQNHVFERMAIGHFESFNLSGTTEPETLRAQGVSADFFKLLGAQPILGRTFLPEDDRPGRATVVVLGHGLWTRRFGADPTIVGRRISLDGQPYTVIGVMGPSFRFPDYAQLWTPTGWDEKRRAVRDNHNCAVVARLKPGVSVSQAQAEMDTISRRLAQQYPVENSGWGAVVIPLHEGLVEDVRPTLLVLLGAVAFVLLIACANVANLVLARTLARRREIAVRLALGASGGRVLRQILTETTLLGVAGGLVGLVVAHFALRLIVAFLGGALPSSTEVTLDAPVLAATLGLSIVSGVLAGLGAAGRLTRANLNEALRQGMGRTGSDASGGRTRTALVTAEVALSIVLLVGAGLMIRSVWLLRQIDPGIDPRNVLTMAVILPEAKYPEGQAAQFYDRLMERVRALPGVDSAGYTSGLPLDPEGGSRWPVALEGEPAAIAAEQPEVAGLVISPGYLRTLRVPVARGRDIDAHDTKDSRAVTLVSEAMAKRFWPGKDPIGKRLTCIFFPGVMEVVGVVRDVKLESLDATSPVQAMYLPLAQHPNGFMALAVRGTSRDPLQNAVAAAVRSLDPDQPVTDVRTMEELVAGSLAQKRFTMLLLAAFAGLALVLAAVGIYSVLSYGVRQRLREIGIRLALGARSNEVIGMVILQGLKPTLAGVVLGLAGAAALTGVLSRFVYGVSSADPATFSAVAALVLAVGVCASLVPAWRATQVDPITTLREE